MLVHGTEEMVAVVTEPDDSWSIICRGNFGVIRDELIREELIRE